MGARRPKDLKPDVIRTTGVYMWRVDGEKVTGLTLGDPAVCHELPSPRGEGMGCRKSAEAIVVLPARGMKG